ncbi:MAG TPA: DNA ligase D [Stellaceae bacterium]|jgi:bifunctional non-homologous end joining protein LigD|nr:DNA ligase D [Stellaceae bacterium]
MALEEYQRKRDFGKTPEPAGAASRRKRPAVALSFVVQKHAATRLHYDFRLELGGVLLSWAVPKGPSLDPGEKRLAVHVEDHPIEYGGFEGVIPKGQYGGGTVLLWDRGTWTPLEPDPDATYRKGSLKFRLDGEKLRGNWALVRMGGKAAPKKPGDHENWLLIKERDEIAEPDSGSALVDDNPLSVATGRAMDAIAKERDRVWDSGKGEVTQTPASSKQRVPAKQAAAARLQGGRAAAMPDVVAPQLATAAERAPDGADWLHEIKYDGYRLLARIERGTVRLTTRKGLDWTAKFPALAEALAELPVDTALLDGEVVALAPDGSTNFGTLQDAIANRDTGALLYYAFDLLYRDGDDLTAAPLDRRKAALAEIVPVQADGTIRYSDHQEGRGSDFLRHVAQYGLEGVVSKRRDRPYRPGRSSDWLKIKCTNRDEFIVIGFTDPSGTRLGFGALVLGYCDPQQRLHYAGRCGTGFSDALLHDLRQRLDATARAKSAANVPKGIPVKDVHWVEPRLVAEVQYSNWTSDGVLRHAAFLGLREDKSAEEVVCEPKNPAARAEPAAPASAKPIAASAQLGSPTVSAPARDGSITFEGVRITHPDRVLYPDTAITKLGLAEYYAAIKDWALPELADRPLSLVRCPDGQGKECFYQKHLSSGVPDALGRVELPEKSGSEIYLVINDLAGLVAMVQMAVLEIHPWGSTTAKVETPDRITFDFDPDEGLPWERVTEAAIEMREALAGIGLQSFAKTTGGKGLHVVVPIAPKLDWDAVKEFAKWVAERFVTAYPDRYTSNMAKRARTGRIFIDYLRNGRGATAIGAYSPRARPGATVATPLFWEEVEKGLKPADLTVLTLPARLANLKSDPWAEMKSLRQSISAKVRREVGI